jgi:hypothetical protein
LLCQGLLELVQGALPLLQLSAQGLYLSLQVFLKGAPLLQFRFSFEQPGLQLLLPQGRRLL